MGVSIINKDVSVISSILSRPKANISTVFGIGGWVSNPTWILSFNDMISSIGFATSNTQTIPENATLYFDLTDENWMFGDITIYKNGVNVFNGIVDTTISFNANDTLYFYVESLYVNTSMTIKQDNISGRIIDTFDISISDPG